MNGASSTRSSFSIEEKSLESSFLIFTSFQWIVFIYSHCGRQSTLSSKILGPQTQILKWKQALLFARDVIGLKKLVDAFLLTISHLDFAIA